MRRLDIGLTLLLATALVLLADKPLSPPPTALQMHVRSEVRRLQAHFDSVDAELQEHSVVSLSDEQRVARAQLVTWLRDYRDAATFPLNDGVADRAVPIFRDSRGVLCAMAYLIQRSGRSDIVDDVAWRRNTASVYELADDSRLIAWLDSTGLTVDEAARIQPAYGGFQDDRHHVGTDYALASLALSGTAMATFAVNVVSPSRTSGLLGLLAGGAATAFGVMLLDQPRGTRRIAAANIGIGAVSMAMAFRGIISSNRPPAATPITGKLDRVGLTPSVLLLGRRELGLILSARF